METQAVQDQDLTYQEPHDASDEVEVEQESEPEQEERPSKKRVSLRDRLREAWDKQAEKEAREAEEFDEAGEEVERENEEQRQAPTSWRAAAKEAWAELPDNIKEEIHKRENDMTKGVKALKDQYAIIDQAAAKYRPALARTGLNDQQIVDVSIGWLVGLMDRDLPTQHKTANAAELVARLVRSGAIDPGQFLRNLGINANYQQAPQQQQQQQQYLTPQQVSQEVNNQLQARDRAQAVAINDARLHSLVSNWARGKPYFKEVESYIAGTIPVAGITGQHDDTTILKTLDALYESALWAHPDIREHMWHDYVKRQTNAQRKEANRARRAGVSLSPSAPGANGAFNGRERKKGLSVRESLREAINEVSQR